MAPAPVVTRVLPDDAASIAEAARCLAGGGLVVFPTETVYGLGADATNGQAVVRIYEAKGRPAFNPLIAHVDDAAQARGLARFDGNADKLARAFWPGPLTLVLPMLEGSPVAPLATAGLDTLGIRVPSNPTTQRLLHTFGGPVVAPSANLSGHVSPTTADHVLKDLSGRVEFIIDGGPCTVGLESTIVACLDGPPRLLRPGGIAREAIEEVLGCVVATELAGESLAAPIAPGQLASHYAPRSQLRLNAEEVRRGEAALAFGAHPLAGAEQAAAIRNLSERGDLVEAAANLFAHLRALDASGAATIAVSPIPDNGLGMAINDRLRRAAAPRDGSP